jgi:hypothetical protein
MTPGAVMTARHRTCVRNASMGGPNGENEAQLYTGEKIRQECLDWGWIQRLPDSPAGFKMYTATELGRAAPVEKKPDRPKISMLKPRVPTLGPLVKPLGKKK